MIERLDNAHLNSGVRRSRIGAFSGNISASQRPSNESASIEALRELIAIAESHAGLRRFGGGSTPPVSVLLVMGIVSQGVIRICGFMYLNPSSGYLGCCRNTMFFERNRPIRFPLSWFPYRLSKTWGLAELWRSPVLTSSGNNTRACVRTSFASNNGMITLASERSNDPSKISRLELSRHSTSTVLHFSFMTLNSKLRYGTRPG